MKKLILAGLALALTASAAFAQADAPPPPGPDGMHERRGPPHGRDAGPPPPSKAAHFRLKRGDVEIDAKCADDEAMKACADTVSQLIDKLASVPR